MKVRKHCEITPTLSCYNVYNDGIYIQELIPNKDLKEFLLVTGAELTEEKLSGVKWPKSEHEKFYKI